MAIEIKLPVLSDGIDSGDVLEVLVSPGDTIEQEQGVVELETDKATVEVPSSHAGKVVEVLVSEGDTVQVGQTLITLEAADAAPAEEPAQESPTPATQEVESAASQVSDEPSLEPSEASPAPPQPAPAEPESEPAPAAPRAAAPPPVEKVSARPRTTAATTSSSKTLPAGPAVRRFAREVGVDLRQIQGSGPGGRITRDDVLNLVRRTNEAARSGSAPAPAAVDATSKDDWGKVRVEKMPKIRKTIAAKMHESWTTCPRVTNFDDADVTDLERIRQSSKADYAEKGIKLTSMPFVIKSVAMALRDHSLLNASLNMEEGLVIYKEYVNIGIAVDTERGLVVPSLRRADQLSIPDIARELAVIADSVRTGDFKIEDLRGSTFTISNLGAIGGTYSTPIINVPEVAILLVGRSRKMPVVINDDIAVRLMMPLSLSYDHRLVDGGAAARFLNDVIAYLEAPSRLLLAP
jgi:pyruvate/2-oxoglutarate dehydrogenase complex dihydrolipoamide acyltransferase (E2) component